MLLRIALVLLAVILCTAQSDVVELTNDNFKDTTKEGYWLVEFFAPWCGHCKKLAPVYEHLAKELKGKANIAKVDCTAQKDICAEFSVKGYPTIKLFHNGEEKEKFAGPRTATHFVSFLKEKAELSVDVNVADLPSDKPAEAKPVEAKPAEPEAPTDVTVLADSTFEETTKEGFWFIEFYAPWCGHCKKLAPAWEHLATQLKGKANIAKVDCTAQIATCSKVGVRGYPTLKLFKDGAEFQAYSGARDVDTFVKFLKEHNVISADVTVSALPGAANTAQKAPQAAEEPEGPNDIIILGESDFAEKIKEGSWFIKFYAPWCGHCKSLAPAWAALATKVNLAATSAVKIAKVDCTKHQNVCKDQGVRGYPTLKFYKDGVETDGYKGGRDLDSLTAFVTQHGFSANIVHVDL